MDASTHPGRTPRRSFLAPGTIVASAGHAWRIVRAIAPGGFAMVYLARPSDPLGGAARETAIKMLDVEHLRERLANAPPAFLDPDVPLEQQMAEVRERFLNESHLLAQLRHPNVVRALDAGVAALGPHKAPFYVMEYLNGTDVERIVAARGALEPAAAVTVTGAVLAALDHLARRGIVHRDVKAANVFVQPTGRAAPSSKAVRLIDFGLATAAGRSLRIRRAFFPHDIRTRPGMLWGTLGWCPPERLAPFLADDDLPETAFDLWGAGLLLYLCLTGVQPFERSCHPTDAEQFGAIVEGRLPAPCDVRADVPPPLAAVACKALALQPRERFSSAAEFLEALREAA